MHNAAVLLGRAQVAGIFEGDPGVAGLEQHREHLAPELFGGNGLEQFDPALLRLRFVVLVAFTEGVAIEVVKVRHIVGREQGPVPVFAHTLDQQVRHPVGGIHVMSTAALIAGVLAQLQEFLDIQVPAFQVGAHRALTLAPLVDGHGGVIHHFQEGHHALATAIGALDVRAQCPHRRPVIAQAASPFGKHGVVADRPVDAFQVVLHGGEVTGGKLGMRSAAVKQGWRGGHVVEGRQQVIEFDGAGIGVVFLQGQAHGHAHEEHLGQLQAVAFPVDEVTVVEGLQAQEAELVVPLRFDGSAQALQIKSGHGLIQ